MSGRKTAMDRLPSSPPCLPLLLLVTLPGIFLLGALAEKKSCYECRNWDKEQYYPTCPRDAAVADAITYRVQCDGHCFTRTGPTKPDMVYRGCLDTQWNIPSPLPPDGCYTFRNDTWCICSGDLCNGKPINQSSGKGLDHAMLELQASGPVILPEKSHHGMPDQCYVCRSFAEGVYYPHCPKNASVNIAITWRENCTGACFTRTDDEDSELVYRGCVDSQWGLPKPLPPDGCYTWYLEVWCICTGHLCNYRKLGTPQNLELDAHITKPPVEVTGEAGANMAAPSPLLLLLALPAFLLSLSC